MAVKPENQFISGVHKYLPAVKVLHREKMNNPFRGGTADWWYSGITSDLWVEYKFLPRVPQKGVVKADLSALQSQWLQGRYKEGRNVAVIVGCPLGGVILRDLEWEKEIPVLEFKTRIISRNELAIWLMQQTLR